MKMRQHKGKEKRDGRGDAGKRKPVSAGRRRRRRGGELAHREVVNGELLLQKTKKSHRNEERKM